MFQFFLMNISFFGIPHWNQFHVEDIPNSEIELLLERIIPEQNQRRYIVIYTTELQNHTTINVRFYKKHATQIVKFIVIGKLNLFEFSSLQQKIDEHFNQSQVIKEALAYKPDIQKLYFNNR